MSARACFGVLEAAMAVAPADSEPNTTRASASIGSGAISPRLDQPGHLVRATPTESRKSCLPSLR